MMMKVSTQLNVGYKASYAFTAGKSCLDLGFKQCDTSRNLDTSYMRDCSKK